MLGKLLTSEWDGTWELLPEAQKKRWTKKSRQLKKHLLRRKKLYPNVEIKKETITGRDLFDLVVRKHENKCAYCGISFEDTGLTIDHKWPLVKGGGHVKSNLVPACHACNNHKGSRTNV